jgi:starch synthase
MRILCVAGEAFPLVKTGGLADVVGALPKALLATGHDVRLVLPGYPDVVSGVFDAEPPLSLGEVLPGFSAEIFLARMPDSQLKVWVVDCPALYERSGGPYLDEHGHDWQDNFVRFALLNRVAALIAVGGGMIGWKPDVVHAHDWQAGLVPVYLRQWQGPRPACVFTIHNLHYQGIFGTEILPRLAIDPKYCTIHGMEFYGNISFLKAGLKFADAITTVSPTYAREIQTPEYGCHMEGVIGDRRNDIHGILNGIDQEVWNPEHDNFLAAPYTADDLAGKAACKARLQSAAGLAPEPNAPIIGMVGRLVWQKGVDILLEAMPQLLEMGYQFIIQGTGEPHLEQLCRKAAAEARGQVAVNIGYDEGFAHVIMGGSDILAVPSRFEPCGLTQLYALRYGTLPLVRRTGGLADSVQDVREGEGGTGFVFDSETAGELITAMTTARDLYNRPAVWQGIQRCAMQQDFSWQSAALHYLSVFDHVCRK